MKRITLLFVCLLFVSASWAQNIQVSGLVTDAADGQPIPGAVVLVKGTKTTAITDADGRYTISAPATASLEFSSMNMITQLIPVQGRTSINVAMEASSRELDELLITALGVSRSEKSVSYSVSQVKEEELTRVGSTSALNALQGKIAGVNISSSSGAPGASSRISIRGYSSIAGSNEPLFVVDGIPVSNQAVQSTGLNNTVDFGNRANDINPNDIETISILKGATASALYGSRAANGVIMITTKKGAQQEPMTIEFVSNTSFSRVGRLPEMQNTFGQGWSGQHDLLENGSWGPKFDGKERVWGHVVDGEQLYKPYVALESNLRDFYETGLMLNNNIAIKGGGEKTTYYASYSNVYNDGVLPTDKDYEKRNTFSFKGSIKGNFLSSAASVNYSNKKISSAGGGQGYTVYNDLLQIPRDLSIVDMKDYKNKFYNIDNFYTPYGIINPYYTLNEYGNTINEDRLFGSFQIGADILPWLNAMVRVGEDYTAYQTKQWTPIISPAPGSPNDGKITNPGSVSEGSGYRSEFSGDIMLSFKPYIGDNFSLNGVAGYNINMRYQSSISMSVTGLDLPNFYNITNSSSTPTVSTNISEQRIIGVFASLDLAYKNYLFLTASARNDWASTLPIDNNSFFYPAVGLSFLFSDAFPSIKEIISYGKLRASYGVTGNAPGAYSLLSTYNSAAIGYPFGSITFPFDGLRAYGLGNTIGNPELKPELTHELEFGADIRFLDNRLGIDVSWYKRNSKNQILTVPIANSSGFGWQFENLGNVENKGWEILVTGTPIRTNNLQWDLSYTFTRNRNKVIELSDLLDEISLGGTTSLGFYAKEGMAMGYFKGAVPEKDPQGRVVVDAKGIPIASTEKDIIGESQSDYAMGLTSNLSFKGLYFSFALDFRKGGLMYSRTADINYFVGNAPQTTYNDRNPFIVPNSVQKVQNYDASGTAIDGQYVYVPNTTPISKENINTYWDAGGVDMDKSFLLDKTMLSLREVAIGYTLPSKWFTGSFVKGIDVSLIGSNLFLWTPDGNRFVDPQVTTFGNGIEADYGEFSTMPTVKRYGFSLKLKF